jgi:hypothetical protein
MTTSKSFVKTKSWLLSHPSRHLCAPLETGNVLESRQHGILHGILGVFRIAQPAHGHSLESRQVARKNISEFQATFRAHLSTLVLPARDGHRRQKAKLEVCRPTFACFAILALLSTSHPVVKHD